MIPRQRLRQANQAGVRSEGRYLLYWMTGARRTNWNYALEHALERAADLERPVLVFEPLRVGYRWANARFHRFVLDGMADNARACAKAGVAYFPYVEPEPDAGKGLLEALAAEACLVVSDETVGFFQPRMLAAAAPRLDVRLDVVDSCGLLPLAAADKVYARAVDLRRFLQRELEPHLEEPPLAAPLKELRPPAELRVAPLRAGHDLACFPDALKSQLRQRWPAASAALFDGEEDALAALPIDHAVAPVALRGGPRAAEAALADFVEQGLASYDEDRNHPDEEGGSGLSPYLHFGHLSVHEVLDAVGRHEDWKPQDVAAPQGGKRAGWWRMSPPAEAFLDELVTWRELGLNFCSRREDYDRYGSLPEWARKTLAEHAGDERPHLYTLADFEAAATHDELWNAAQRQLLYEGRMHNYLRMLWGKKVLHWTASPEEALAILIELNNKYALDGRDPNSYSGIFWVFGRYDRAWGPEREVFGKVRTMTSANTRRKLRLSQYLEHWGPEARRFG